MATNETVRPRINKAIYELVKKAASASCMADSHWLADAIREKAAREGFEIVAGEVVNSGRVMIATNNQNHSH